MTRAINIFLNIFATLFVVMFIFAACTPQDKKALQEQRKQQERKSFQEYCLNGVIYWKHWGRDG